MATGGVFTSTYTTNCTASNNVYYGYVDWPIPVDLPLYSRNEKRFKCAAGWIEQQLDKIPNFFGFISTRPMIRNHLYVNNIGCLNFHRV